MHKLLLRQLKRYTNIESEKKVPSELVALMQAISQSYDEYEGSIGVFERTLEVSSLELMQKNTELTKTLGELEHLQSQNVNSAKMALIGQLVAGIAHEINTPIGAITASIKEINKYHNNTLEEPDFNCLKEQKQLYLDLCTFVAKQQKCSYSTKELRLITKSIMDKLESAGISLPLTTAQELATIGFNEQNLDGVIIFLKQVDGPKVINSIIRFGLNYVYIKNINIASDRIASLVAALRSYSRASTGVKTETDVNVDIDTTITILHSRLKEGITVIKEYKKIPKLICYPEQLNQVWTNILINASQALKGSGQIIVRTSFQNDQIIAEFEDNGPGIPPEVMSKLFEPYFTTKPKGEGLGIGLNICKEIVEKHKGSISVDSKVGNPGSTCFKVSLPIDRLIQS